MNLRIKYASFLLFILLLLIGVSTASVYLLYTGRYMLLIPLLGLLYLTTYFLGSYFSKIFFTLSFLRFLRKREGVAGLEQYRSFLYNSLTPRQKHRFESLQEDILTDLIEDKVVFIQNDTIYLSMS